MLDETGIFRERRFTIRNIVKRLLDVDMQSHIHRYDMTLADCETVIGGGDMILYSVIKILLRHDLNMEVASFALYTGEYGIQLTSTGIKDFRVGK